MHHRANCRRRTTNATVTVTVSTCFLFFISFRWIFCDKQKSCDTGWNWVTYTLSRRRLLHSLPTITPREVWLLQRTAFSTATVDFLTLHTNAALLQLLVHHKVSVN